MSVFLVTQAQSFLPDDASEWLGFISGCVIFGLTIGTLIVKMGRDRQKQEDKIAHLEEEMDRRFKEQGERIGQQEASCSGQSQSIDELKRLHSLQELEINTNIRDLGELRGGGRELKDEISAQGADMTMIRERIARLEERTRLYTHPFGNEP